MPLPIRRIQLRRGDRVKLQRLERSRTASGLSGRALCTRVGVSRPTVTLWLDRYEAGGFAALVADRPRSGRPKRTSPAVRRRDRASGPGGSSARRYPTGRRALRLDRFRRADPAQSPSRTESAHERESYFRIYPLAYRQPSVEAIGEPSLLRSPDNTMPPLVLRINGRSAGTVHDGAKRDRATALEKLAEKGSLGIG